MNGDLVIDLNDVNYREKSSVKISGAHYSTFFGGSDDSWAPPENQYAEFRNFELIQD